MGARFHPAGSRVGAQAAHLSKLRGFCENGRLHAAMATVQSMLHDGLPISTTIFCCLAEGCVQRRDLESGKRLYSLALVACGDALDSFLGCRFIDMFSACGSLHDASSVFDHLHDPSVFGWNAILAANVRHGRNQEAVHLYQRMLHRSAHTIPDGHVCVTTLKACSNAYEMLKGQVIHSNIVEYSLQCNVVTVNALIDMYHRCGSLLDAYRTFCQSSRKDLVTWNSMISGFASHKQCKEAYQLMEQMSCNGMEPNIVTWNSLLSGYVLNGDCEKALMILQRMQQAKIEPDRFTFTSALKACATRGDLGEGKRIHVQLMQSGIKLDLQIRNALVDMYIKCQGLEDACKEASRLSTSCDAVTWTSMIVGFAQHGYNHMVLQFLREMEQGDKKPDCFTFSSLLKASTDVGAIDQGMVIHAYVIEMDVNIDKHIQSATIDMYAKCGSLECARSVFSKLLDRDVGAWSAMIGGCCCHGEYEMALAHLQCMLCTGVEPNSVIFLCLLSACGHCGIVDEGKGLFVSMPRFHGIMPMVEHFNCIVDMLGRLGCLDEAEEILKGMPFQCNVMGWISLLNSCKLYTNVPIGRRCFNQTIALDERIASVYLLMFSIYADANMPEAAHRIHEMKKDAFARKVAEMHSFCVGDESHPLTELDLCMRN